MIIAYLVSMDSCKDGKSRKNNKNGISQQLVCLDKDPSGDFKSKPFELSITIRPAAPLVLSNLIGTMSLCWHGVC